jgi:hypothetical protein
VVEHSGLCGLCIRTRAQRPTMIETKQQSLTSVSSSKISSPQSPEMTRKEKTKPISIKKRNAGVAASNSNSINVNGTTSSVLRSKNLPPRPPPPPPLLIEEKSEPPSHLQLASSEDLSFADFSAMEDSLDYCYEQNPNNTSLSGFLEESPDSLNNSNSNHINGSATNNHRRSQQRKVNAVDVASVGNASDTMVHNMATRDLHEKAKMAFNAADYNEALPLFESILSAQLRRFSTLHPSVGAAMHNVGVSEYTGYDIVFYHHLLYTRRSLS